MKVAQFLLRELTKRIPPCEGCRHNITLNELGFIEITLMVKDKYQPILLDEEDLGLPLEDLLQEILGVLDGVAV